MSVCHADWLFNALSLPMKNWLTRTPLYSQDKMPMSFSAAKITVLLPQAATRLYQSLLES